MQELSDTSTTTPRNKVALVLGAGASRNYGFPTGPELAEKLLNGPSPPDHAPPGHRNPHLYEEFKTEFQRFRNGNSRSIDSFLNSDHGARFLFIARFAMSLIISGSKSIS